MALAVFSLKRNRSGSSTSKIYENNHEPVNKLSRLFNKFTSSILYHKQQQQNKPIRRASIKKLHVIFKNENEEPKIPILNLVKEEDNLQLKRPFSQHSEIIFSKKEKLEYDPRYLSTVQTAKNGLPGILIRRPSSLSDMRSTAATPIQYEKEINHHSALSLNEEEIDRQLQQHYLTINSASNMTTCSGDLSAKEFADMAGIKIISDNSDSDEDEDDNESLDKENHSEWNFDHHDHSHHQSFLSSNISSKNHSFLTDHDKLSIHTSSSSVYSNKQHKKYQPHIWDSEFWQQPSSSILKKQLQHNQDIPNVLYELRKLNTTSNEHLSKKENNPLRKQRSCVIKKGRFEVSLETTDC
ncbi:unnamed protein product [Cunninghamella blakesleeana]